jgi:hypothetical protein
LKVVAFSKSLLCYKIAYCTAGLFWSGIGIGIDILGIGILGIDIGIGIGIGNFIGIGIGNFNGIGIGNFIGIFSLGTGVRDCGIPFRETQ